MGQVYCDTCPEIGSIQCELWPDACAACWDTCVDRPWHRRAGGRIGPAPYHDPNVGDYTLSKTVGVAQIAYSEAWQSYQPAMQHSFTTAELFDELAYHGIRAVRLWLTVPYWDGVEYPDGTLNPNPIFEDMREVWEHPNIDTIMVILTDYAHTGVEVDCDGNTTMTWINDPVEKFARFMFENFPDQDKTVIIANTETDNQWRGFRCFEPDEMIWDSIPPADVEECLAEFTKEECVVKFSKWRMDYAIRQVEKRQRIVQQVRAEYPNAKLRLRTSMTTSVFSAANAKKKFLGMYALSKVMSMKWKPDYIGISHWQGSNMTILQAIAYVRRATWYPPNRLIIDQIGSNDRRNGRQYDVITSKTHDSWDAGANLVLVWIWKETWRRPVGGSLKDESKGLWDILCEAPDPWCGWGDPKSGLWAVYELNEEAQEE